MSRALLEALSLEHPPWPGEGAIHYVERLNVLAGLLDRSRAGQLLPGEDLKARKGPAAEESPRLPYKDHD